MKARPDCVVCLFRQALSATRLVTNDPDVQLRVMARLGHGLSNMTLDQTPANLSQPAYEAVAAETGVTDPYHDVKQKHNRTALQLLPRLRELISAAEDPLDAALHAAVAGNIIDLGIGHTFDIETDVLATMRQPFALNSQKDLRAELVPGAKVLYLGDNAGEIVFDRLLIEQLLAAGAVVTYTVKSGPIINDATLADAREVGMTEQVPVIETGGRDIGVNWGNVSNAFRRAFESADLIISKGHGNFETCDDRPENIYFLLKAKCTMVAAELGAALGDIVFTRRPRRSPTA